MFHSNYRKSLLLQPATKPDPTTPAPEEVKTRKQELVTNGNVQAMFKLSDSRVLICERGMGNWDHKVYVIDLKTSEKATIDCNFPFFPEKDDHEELEFGFIEECLELNPNCLILRLRTNHCPYPCFQHLLVLLNSEAGLPVVIENAPDLEFGRTTVLTRKTVASLRYSDRLDRTTLDVFYLQGINLHLDLSFKMNKHYYSITAVNETTLVLGGRNGDVDIFQINDNELIQIGSLTEALATGRNPLKKSASDENQFVRMIGKNRDILLVAERSWCTEKNIGMVSLWRRHPEKKLFESIAYINTHNLNGIDGFMEFDDGEHFALLDKPSDILVLNTKLQSFHFPYQIEYRTFLDYPEGVMLYLSNGHVTKFQMDYRAVIKAEVEQSTPFHDKFGDLSRYIAEYALIGEEGGDEVFKVKPKM